MIRHGDACSSMVETSPAAAFTTVRTNATETSALLPPAKDLCLPPAKCKPHGWVLSDPGGRRHTWPSSLELPNPNDDDEFS